MVQSGYKVVTPAMLAGVLHARQAGTIGGDAVRVYFAGLAAIAAREAAERTRKKRGRIRLKLNCYRHAELGNITRLDCARVRRALRQLERADVLTFSEEKIEVSADALPGSETLQAALAGSRSAKRPIPVPRRLLRFLAQNRAEVLTQVMCGYLSRGLSIARRTGEITAKGTVKASWIAETFGVSSRAVKYAQAALRRVGWISKDTQSHQLKLNRDGAYFVMNLDWNAEDGSRREAKRESSAKPCEPIVHRDKNPVAFAPLPVEKCTDFAPPKKDKETSNEDQNQKTFATVEQPSGVCWKKGSAPKLQQIEQEDLFHFGRLECLYGQAVQAGWIEGSEAAALNFVAAAVRAREVGREPVRVFVALVRRKLWHHITQAQEDHARRALNRFRETNPSQFRGVGAAHATSSLLKEAKMGYVGSRQSSASAFL